MFPVPSFCLGVRFLHTRAGMRLFVVEQRQPAHVFVVFLGCSGLGRLKFLKILKEVLLTLLETCLFEPDPIAQERDMFV